jgi:S1-C subfamily serine protease
MNRLGRFMLIVAALAAAVALAAGGLFMLQADTGAPSLVRAAPADPGEGQGVQQAGSDTFTQIYNNVSPSVVAIRIYAQSRRGGLLAVGTGSGFVVDSEGHIATNYHVVESASLVEVDFFDGTLTWAEVVGLDPDSDLAVLKVDVPPETLTPVSFGDSDSLQVGETVLAIGSPFGQKWTLTSGIVSGLNRTIEGLSEFSIGGVIQTDAAINPGNSGGPLLNLQGQVIGVNAQISTVTGANSGVGYAIPGNLARQVIESLITRGDVDYSYIGISGRDLMLPDIEQFDLPNDTRGIVVEEVVRGGPADRAGLRRFDIITAIDGTPLKGMNDLITYLARETVPGDTVQLSILRQADEPAEVTVTLMPRP